MPDQAKMDRFPGCSQAALFARHSAQGLNQTSPNTLFSQGRSLEPGGDCDGAAEYDLTTTEGLVVVGCNKWADRPLPLAQISAAAAQIVIDHLSRPCNANGVG